MELLALRGRIPEFFSITVANCLLVLINVFLYWGIRGPASSAAAQRWLLPAFVFLTAAISLYFSYVRPDVSARIIGISAIAVLQYALIVHLLSGHPGPERIHMPRLGLSVLCHSLCGDQYLSRMGGSPARSAHLPDSSAATSIIRLHHPDSDRRHDCPRRHLACDGAAPA